MTAAKPKLDIDATRERLSALGCGYAAEHLGHLLGEAVRAEIAPHSFLDQLLAVELSAREERRVKTSLKLSSLPTGQTLENFDFAFQPAIERSRIDTLASCAWVRGTETVLLQGPPGVGKTQVSRALPGPVPRGRRRGFRLRRRDRGSGPVADMPATGPRCRPEPGQFGLRRA